MWPCPIESRPENWQGRAGRVPVLSHCPPAARASPPSRRRKGPRAWQNAGARIYRTSTTPVGFVATGIHRSKRSLVGINLISRNPVDLECDGIGRFAVDESDALEVFRAHRKVHDHVHRIVEAGRALDFRHLLPVA